MIEPQSRRIIGICVSFGAAVCWLLPATPARKTRAFCGRFGSDKSNMYILGSIHFLKKENYPLNKTIEKAFDGTKKLVLEIDLKSADPGTVQRVTLEKGINRDRKTLQQNVSPETYSLAEKRAQELGIDIRALSPLKPWVVALTMTSLQLQKLGFDPNYGVDRYLAERAVKSGKATAGLETVEFQIGLIDQLSEKDQESMLRQSLKEMDLLDRGAGPDCSGLVHGGRSVRWKRLLLSGMREYPAVHQKLIVDRNRRWLPQIEKMIEQGESTLIVGGSGASRWQRRGH